MEFNAKLAFLIDTIKQKKQPPISDCKLDFQNLNELTELIRLGMFDNTEIGGIALKTVGDLYKSHHNYAYYQSAAMWYQLAFEKGNMRVCYDLGQAFSFGISHPKDIAKAKHYYSLGMNNNCVRCALALANIEYTHDAERGIALYIKILVDANNDFNKTHSSDDLSLAYERLGTYYQNQKKYDLALTSYVRATQTTSMYSANNLISRNISKLYDLVKISDNIYMELAWYQDLYLKCPVEIVQIKIKKLQALIKEKEDILIKKNDEEIKDAEIKRLQEIIDNFNTSIKINNAENNIDDTDDSYNKKRKTRNPNNNSNNNSNNDMYVESTNIIL
jgi:hypothetical protein